MTSMKMEPPPSLGTAHYGHQHIALIMALLLFAPIFGWLISRGLGGQMDWLVSQLLSLHGDAAHGAWAKLLIAVTWLGHFGPRTAMALILAYYVYRIRGAVGAAVLLGCFFAASGYSSLLKAIFDRERPDIIVHLDHVSSASYPSGHAAGAMVIMVMLATIVPPRFRSLAWVIALLWVGLMSISRLALGVHWLTDIIGGLAIGLGFALLARPFIQWRARTA
ncbi:phosphatase PAP2 family protein [Sphingopyxis yananensis]|uniref:phosphatase PAP2 family protein n=1 Tax=Sphingopyxis yananensis TaxID=2886687 RepID=UPI001D0F63AF|nr:phosphatase PAP2 family protein [Sphingopyxis yananensis]MCC2601014.1 phosphatase PAP2 family protein [Sphingopyxis yananensis]